MKILFFCDSSVALGNTARASRIYDYVQMLGFQIKYFNLYNWHKKWSKLLMNKAVVKSLLGNLHKKHIPYIKNEVYIKFGGDILDRAIKEMRPDIIFTEETRPAYMAVQNSHGIPVISDLHGLTSAEYEECPTAKVHPGFLARIKEIEESICSNAERLFVVSSNMKEYLAERYNISPGKMTVVQNGADINTKRARYCKKMSLVYGGIFNFWEDVDTYLDLARRSNVYKYYLIGTGPLKKHLMNRIDREGIKMNYLGCMEKSKALDSFCNMNVGVAPSTRNMTRYVASPVKIYDYMACGLPVLTVDCGEWARQVRDNDCGIVAEDSTADGFLEGIEKIQDKKTWEEKSFNGREAIRTKYNWDKILTPISDVLQRY